MCLVLLQSLNWNLLLMLDLEQFKDSDARRSDLQLISSDIMSCKLVLYFDTSENMLVIVSYAFIILLFKFSSCKWCIAPKVRHEMWFPPRWSWKWPSQWLNILPLHSGKSWTFRSMHVPEATPKADRIMFLITCESIFNAIKNAIIFSHNEDSSNLFKPRRHRPDSFKIKNHPGLRSH